MPTKKKKATAAKKEEPVGALTEEERLVLAQGEALKVRTQLVILAEFKEQWSSRSRMGGIQSD